MFLHVRWSQWTQRGHEHDGLLSSHSLGQPFGALLGALGPCVMDCHRWIAADTQYHHKKHLAGWPVSTIHMSSLETLAADLKHTGGQTCSGWFSTSHNTKFGRQSVCMGKINIWVQVSIRKSPPILANFLCKSLHSNLMHTGSQHVKQICLWVFHLALCHLTHLLQSKLHRSQCFHWK